MHQGVKGRAELHASTNTSNVAHILLPGQLSYFLPPQLFSCAKTSSQINDTFLFHCVIKILTGGRILQISIAWCQIDGEIHSFPTMYGKGGGRCGKNWRNQGFRPKVMPKTRFFWGHKSGSSHFRVAWDPLFQRWCQFRYVPQKVWVKSFQMSYGHVW